MTRYGCSSASFGSRAVLLIVSWLWLFATSTAGAAPTCDESKCRTLDANKVPGYWWLPPPSADFEGGYTCWVDQDKQEYPCADGYTGHAVTNITQLEETTGSVQSWYTCCLEEDANEPLIIQTCTDAHYPPETFSGWAVPDGLAPKACDGSDFPFPRDTGATIPMDHGDVVYDVQQFLCCSTELDDDEDDDEPDRPLDQDGDLLVDTCSTAACTSLDGGGGAGDCWADGVTEPFTCNTQDRSNPFIYPTRNGHDDVNMFNFHYVCCQSKNHLHPYFEENQWDGLQVALLIQSTLSLVTFLVSSVFTLGILTNRKVRSHAWNIYLVMVSIPDVIYNLFRFIYGLIVITRSNTFIQTTWTIDWFYAVANLLLNAVIVYEVHKFLRAFKQMRRIPPPSIKAVLTQSFVVYVLAAGCGLWMFHLHTVGNNIAGSHPRFLLLHKVSLCCMVIPPITFVTWICFDVWYRQLLPVDTGRTRTLALYFLRVIFVFMVTWLPYMMLITFGLRSSRLLGYIGLFLSSVQGTLSVFVALSKKDVQWAVQSFVTCQCNTEVSQDDNARSRFSNVSKGNVRISGLFSRPYTETRVSNIDPEASAEIVRRHVGTSSADFSEAMVEPSELFTEGDEELNGGTSEAFKVEDAADENNTLTHHPHQDGVSEAFKVSQDQTLVEDPEEEEEDSASFKKGNPLAQEQALPIPSQSQPTRSNGDDALNESLRGRIDMTGQIENVSSDESSSSEANNNTTN